VSGGAPARAPIASTAPAATTATTGGLIPRPAAEASAALLREECARGDGAGEDREQREGHSLANACEAGKRRARAHGATVHARPRGGTASS
jgi:hypothetical protein